MQAISKFFLLPIAVSCWIGCGLFTPRTDFEPPISDQGGTVDHFNFVSLLEESGEKFSKLDWYELFDDDFRYINVRLASGSYGKTDLINHLSQQHEIYPDAKVDWVNREGIIRNINTITLSNVDYTVECSNDTFTGTGSFRCVRDDNNIWRIMQWNDDPDENQFFSPAE